MKKFYTLQFSFAILFVFINVKAQDFPKFDNTFRLKQLEPPTGKVRMVLDTDTYNEVDDQFALAYALLSPEKIQLEAVYAAPFKNKRSNGPGEGMEKSYQEILRLLKLMNKPSDNFAFRGSNKYLPDITNPVKSDAATDLIQRAKKSSPENPLYVVAIGCITNVASAILQEPQIIENIVVVWIGGNGLHWQNQVEFNLMQDAIAAQVVFNSGVPLVILPARPVVSHLITTVPEVKHYLEGKSKLSNYLYNIVVGYSQGREAFSKVIWDVAAIAWLINPKLVRTDIVHCPVLTDQLTYSIDNSKHFIRMAHTVRRDGIYRDMFTKLAQY